MLSLQIQLQIQILDFKSVFNLEIRQCYILVVHHIQYLVSYTHTHTHTHTGTVASHTVLILDDRYIQLNPLHSKH